MDPEDKDLGEELVHQIQESVDDVYKAGYGLLTGDFGEDEDEEDE